MVIVFCIDRKYEEYARVSILSYRRYNQKAKIIVVSEEPIKEEIGFDENVIIKLPQQFRNRGKGDRITNTAYLRLFLTQLPYDKVLYVDADTLCQKPLDDLWNLDIEYVGVTESHKYGKKQAEELGLERYALSGMMLMNLANLRKIGFTDRCIEFARKNTIPIEIWRHDETCLNLGMKGLLTFIDKKFNYCHNREYDNPIDEGDAYILHFVGKDKEEMDRSLRYPELSVIKDDIKGKRVAIVGNAKSQFEKEYGKLIDSYDFVIRFNRGFITKPKSQGTKTSMVILACLLTEKEARDYGAKYIVNRSMNYKNDFADLTIGNLQRAIMASGIGAQPSSGFMAVNICLTFGAKEIALFGFDWGESKTFYNPDNYQTQHNYNKEKDILRGYEGVGMLKIF